MNFDQIWELVEPIPGYYHMKEMELLTHTAQGRTRVLEIGCLAGKSTLGIALSMRRGDIVVIDLFSQDNCPTNDGLHRSMRMAGDVSYMLMETDSRLVAAHDIGAFDMAHIDGNHTHEGVLADLNLCASVTDTIVCHDYQNQGLPGVTSGIDEFLNNQQWRISDKALSVVVIRKT